MACSLIFGGDIAVLRDDPTNMFGELTPIIRDADLAIANLEFPLSDRGRPMRGKIYPHKGPPSAVAALVETGFDAFNLANNHMLDYGEEPLLDTMALLDKAGIARLGAGANLAEAEAPVVLERGGLRIGLLGFTTTLPTGFAASESQCGVNPFRVTTVWRSPVSLVEYPGTAPLIETAPVAEDLDRLVTAIGALKARTDIVLVYAHWGTSMTEAVHDFQRLIARSAIEAGADAVFGGHQHVVSAVELIHGRPVMHGLGNLVFDFVAPFFTEATRRTILFAANITRSGLTDCRLIPCKAGVNGPVSRLDPRQGEGAALAAALARLSEPLGCRLEVGEDIRVRPAGV